MRYSFLAVIALVLSACGGQSPPPSSAVTASVAASASAPAASAPAGGFELQPAPADLGCDAMGVPYRTVTFAIDPAADDPVTAVTESGTTLTTYWSPGFVGDAAATPVVRDPSGQVVATNGETLAIPEGDWPRLHGYFVCPSPDALYVLLQDPT